MKEEVNFYTEEEIGEIISGAEETRRKNSHSMYHAALENLHRCQIEIGNAKSRVIELELAIVDYQKNVDDAWVNYRAFQLREIHKNEPDPNQVALNKKNEEKE